MLYQLSYQVVRDSTGARTQDPLLKREMLYQLSYRIRFQAANIVSIIQNSIPKYINLILLCLSYAATVFGRLYGVW
jgi:hypothetical protein